MGKNKVLTYGIIGFVLGIVATVIVFSFYPGSTPRFSVSREEAAAFNPEIGHLKVNPGPNFGDLRISLGEAALQQLLDFSVEGSSKKNAFLQNMVLDLGGNLNLGAIKEIGLWGGSPAATKISSISNPDLSRIYLGFNGFKLPKNETMEFRLAISFYPDFGGFEEGQSISAKLVELNAFTGEGRIIKSSGLPISVEHEVRR